MKLINRILKNDAAGLLMYDIVDGEMQILLGHPGGPYYWNKDDGYWTIPKGTVEGDEDFLFAAQREFKEETGIEPHGPFIPLGSYEGRAKFNHIWAFRKAYDLSLGVSSNTFHMIWPPGSGTEREFPEIDRCGWFDVEHAKQKISKSQIPMIDNLVELLQDDIELFK